MNCKPGDLAIVVRMPLKAVLSVGSIVRVDRLSPAHADAWITDPALVCPVTGRQVHIRDSILRPIRDPGDDAVDETLLRLPSPRQEVTA